MAHIVPSISFVKAIKRYIQSGQSISAAIQSSIEDEQTIFSVKVQKWYASQQSSSQNRLEVAETHFQNAFFEILKGGLEGAPIFELLEELEEEMVLEFDRQWKLYLERLPLLLSLPLLLFFFPSYIILMFGPLLIHFLSEVN